MCAMNIQIQDHIAHNSFIKLVHEMSLDPDDQWVGRYAEYEWCHSRYIFECSGVRFDGSKVLEMGCNFGATSIVMAALGAQVVAIDVSKRAIELAKLNAERYGVQNNIDFMCLNDTTDLPFDNEYFDIVTCNSVLEYINHLNLKDVQQEIDRVLKHQGYIFVLGTSNRIWPKEVHSHRWGVNYIPRGLDTYLFGDKIPARGVWPWDVCAGFGKYENCDYTDRGRSYFEARTMIGVSGLKNKIMRWANKFTSIFGFSVGLITPDISVTLRKK